jgi:hypothetical protein
MEILCGINLMDKLNTVNKLSLIKGKCNYTYAKLVTVLPDS